MSPNELRAELAGPTSSSISELVRRKPVSFELLSWRNARLVFCRSRALSYEGALSREQRMLTVCLVSSDAVELASCAAGTTGIISMVVHSAIASPLSSGHVCVNKTSSRQIEINGGQTKEVVSPKAMQKLSEETPVVELTRISPGPNVLLLSQKKCARAHETTHHQYYIYIPLVIKVL